ncbi:phosphomethylpyrimidine kinase [Methanobrevibacter arboriphilus JCM 13429 = DSM 1125]|uniref:Phosphomethylpyrimidine kinase n=1 Tax=Methanobrevibacter arboriphilus JCM 13429 = DSM 1125 TaxID=1300164 RepID=A0A1V6N2V0_METAZ|nr:bifunctional hydroxymethylpyrimidine kinase/phosphomethylpyrimidine kinase [Methanobrevibacter arboriphilus]OQD59001.1 phosphomethylpyrimidine kinase [Methanobrevibacter arboriphilus JCM 13429 = DSM 1125]
MMGISIAGLDPSGGAGIIADMKTFQALDIHGTSVITALTSQNPNKVFSLMPVDTEYIKEQFDSIFDGYGEYINYGKTGMLYSPEIIKTVAKKIKEYDINIVVDPVMIASAGGPLLKDEKEIKKSKEIIANALKKYLLPKSIITTPNIAEAEILAGMKIDNPDDAKKAAYKIGKISNVIITGGHLNGINTIFNKSNNELKTIKKVLIETKNTHGSGCTFSAALTSYLIKENNLNITDLNITDLDITNLNITNLNTNNLSISIEKSLDFTEIAIKNGEYGTLKQARCFNHEKF